MMNSYIVIAIAVIAVLAVSVWLSYATGGYGLVELPPLRKQPKPSNRLADYVRNNKVSRFNSKPVAPSNQTINDHKFYWECRKKSNSWTFGGIW